MTRHDKHLAEVLLARIENLTPSQTVESLFDMGLVNRRACEQLAIRTEIERLQRGGMGRCRAMEMTAETLCCSYEKVRDSFYNSYKT